MENTTNNHVSGSQNSASTEDTIQDPDHSLWNVFRNIMLYRRQWLTYAFQSVITTGINIHVQEPDWSFFTNWSSPSLQPARILGHHGGLWKQHHSEYPILKLLLRTCSFISPWPGYNANRGRIDVPPERTEGQFAKQRGQSKENQPKEQGFECNWSLTNFRLQSQREKQRYCFCVFNNLCYAPYWSIGLRALI